MLLLLGCTAMAQQEAPFLEEAQKEFEQGLHQFDLEHWHAAAGSFETVARKLPRNHRSTAAYVMAARAYFLDGKPSFSLRLIEEMQRLYPRSSYLAEGFLIAGDAALLAGARSTALQWYIQSWFAENNDRQLLKRKITELHPDAIPAGEQRPVRALLRSMPDDSELTTLLQPRAVQPTPNEKRGSADAPAASAEPLRIAAALPMHEQDARRFNAVRDLRDGMLAALDLHRAGEGPAVVLEILDSGNEDSLRSSITRLERDDHALVLLAGAFSDDAERVCRIAAERGLLVLLPTATAGGLPELGSNIFQLNTPILQRARLLADFTMLELNAERAVVIAPKHSYAREMAEAFIDRCRTLEIPVQLAGWYGESEDELGRLCAAAAGHAGAKNCILFAPVQSRNDITAVLKGIRDAQLSIPVVGGGNWNHPDLLARYGRDCTVYFESDVVADSAAADYARLQEAFQKRSARALSREALFGFDAMHLALSLIRSETCTRQEVRKRIMDVFDGLRGPVNFQRQRVNAAMNILVSRRGVIQRMDAFHAK